MEQTLLNPIQAQHRVALLILSLLLLVLVIELVRRGALREKYALLWLATAGFGLLVGLWPGLIVRLSNLLHFQFVTVLFVLSFLFLMGLVMSFSIAISRLSERNRALTQEVALLTKAVEDLEKRREP